MPSSIHSHTSIAAGKRGRADAAPQQPDAPSVLPGDDVCGIVLAGSRAWGDGEFERLLCGPLLPLAQTPLVCYPLRWLRSGGVRETKICANAATDAVSEFLQDGHSFGMSLEYVRDEIPRGPAGCAHDAARLSAARTFVVVEGALLPSVDLAALLAAHRESGAAATVVVEIERRRRAIAGLARQMPGGIYVLERHVLESVQSTGYHDIKEGLLERLFRAGEQVATYEVQGLAPRVLDYATYASVNRWMIGQAVEHPMFLRDFVPVASGLRHPSAQVHPSVHVIGPVLLGPRVQVHDHAVLVGPTTIGADTVVASGALVSRSIVWQGCRVGAAALVDGSFLADDVVVDPAERLFGAVALTHGRRSASSPLPMPDESEDPVRLLWTLPERLGTLARAAFRQQEPLRP